MKLIYMMTGSERINFFTEKVDFDFNHFWILTKFHFQQLDAETGAEPPAV